LVGQNIEHAGQSARGFEIKGFDSPLRNATREQVSISDIGQRHVRRVQRLASDFGANVITRNGLAHIADRRGSSWIDHRLALQFGGLQQRADQGRLAERDLKGVVDSRSCVGKCGSRGGFRDRLGQSFPNERVFRFPRPPWDRGEAAQSDPSLTDLRAVHVEGHGRGSEREFIGLAIANLEIKRAPCPGACGEIEASNEIAWRENGLHVWCCAGGPVQGAEGDGPDAGRACNVNRRAERDQTLGKVAGISRDAVGAATKDGMLPVQTANRGAARTRIALVAGSPGCIAKIGAPGPLKHIAVRRRHVAKLRARSELQALGNDRIILDYLRMVGGGRHLDHGAKPYAVGRNGDGVMNAGKRS